MRKMRLTEKPQTQRYSDLVKCYENDGIWYLNGIRWKIVNAAQTVGSAYIQFFLNEAV